MNSTQGVLNAKFRLLFPAVQRFVCQSYEKAEIAKRNGGIREIFPARSLRHVDRWCPLAATRRQHAKIPGSNTFRKNAHASLWKAAFLKPIAPKSPQEHRPGSAILSERIINQVLISRNAPKSASLFRRNERHY